MMTVPVASTIEAVRQAVGRARAAGARIRLVPTMGALHAGHISLIRAARADGGFVVVSIFVNPAQFGPNEDFTRYPRPIEDDLQRCTGEGVDLVFAPEAAVMYPPGFCTYVEVQGLQDVLEGASRPGHFRGVATVVLKLFHIVQPDVAYFGQKDAQQAVIIRRMVRDLDLPVEVRVCPIVREPDGLALSSRNQYLSPEQRQQAVVLWAALQEGVRLVAAGERAGAAVERTLAARIQAEPGATLDYAAVVDAETLEPLPTLRGRVLLALAVRFGATRLIDNTLIELP
jgi:pantoate--beta-alanine ligase